MDFFPSSYSSNPKSPAVFAMRISQFLWFQVQLVGSSNYRQTHLRESCSKMQLPGNLVWESVVWKKITDVATVSVSLDWRWLTICSSELETFSFWKIPGNSPQTLNFNQRYFDKWWISLLDSGFAFLGNEKITQQDSESIQNINGFRDPSTETRPMRCKKMTFIWISWISTEKKYFTQDGKKLNFGF